MLCSLREWLESFFVGKIYPIMVCSMMLAGYLTGLEFYFHIVNMLLLTVALMVSTTVRPLMAPLCSFVFQISLQNTPATHNISGFPSDYYFTEGRGEMVVLSFAVVAFGFAVFFIRNNLITKAKLASLPLLFPSVLLALAFVFGGAFSDAWEIASLGFSLVQIVCWFLIFFVFYLGLKYEDADDVMEYFVYVCSLVALVLIAETVNLYATTDIPNHLAGGLNRAKIVYGWGICQTAAQALMTLVPVILIGVSRCKWHTYYFVVAHLALAASIMNVSRTAAICGIPIYLIALFISIARSKKKKRLLIAFFAMVAAGIVIFALYWDKLWPSIDDYIFRGFFDNGRFERWKFGIEAFLEDPIFGKGFFGLSESIPLSFTHVSFIPMMLHNTPVQMLACFGIFGAVAYSVYRLSTLKPFLKRPSYEKTMLGLSILFILIGSLLENYVFYIMPMFTYSIALAIVYKYADEGK